MKSTTAQVFYELIFIGVGAVLTKVIESAYWVGIVIIAIGIFGLIFTLAGKKIINWIPIKIVRKKKEIQLIQSPVPIDTLGWLQSKVNEHWHSPERFVYSRLTKVFLSSPTEVGLVTEWFNCSLFGLKIESVSGEVRMGEVGFDVESIGHQIKLQDKILLDMCGHCTTTYYIQLADTKKIEQFRDAISKKRPLLWRLNLNTELSTVGYSRRFPSQSQLDDKALIPEAS